VAKKEGKRERGEKLDQFNSTDLDFLKKGREREEAAM